MAFTLFDRHAQGVQLLQRSLARGRLGHAYLFAGDQLEELESLARTLAKTLNCQQPVQDRRRGDGLLRRMPGCRKIDGDTHADIHWARPESKSRVVTIDQMRELMREIQLKPTEAEYKVAIIAGADRLNAQAANAFLKTLEEPPAKSVLILLSTEPQRILETILSRCLRLNFSGDGKRELNSAETEWLEKFGALGRVGTKKLAGPLPAARCAAAKARRNPGAHRRNRWPRARRSKNTTTWKRICARNGRTNWPPPSRPNTAGSAPICSCSSNGGCAMSGSIPSPPARNC